MSPRVRPVLLYGGLCGAVALSGTFAYGALAPASSKTATSSRTVTVQLGTVSQTVSADGSLTPAGDYTLTFGTIGTITEIDVAAGDTVKSGQVLGKLDPAKAQLALEVASLNLSSAQTKLTDAESGTSSTSASGNTPTQATVDADQTSLDDAQQSAAINANGYQLAVNQAHENQAAAQQQLESDQQACAANSSSSACGRITADQDAVRKADDAVASAQQAQAAGTQKDQTTIHNAQAKLAADRAALSNAESAQASAVDPSTVATAKSNVLNAQDAVTAAQKALDATTLRAPSAGTITALNVKVGDAVSGTGTTSNTSSASSSSAQSGGGNSNANSNSSGSTANASSSSSSSSSSFGTLLDTSGYSVSVAVPEADATKVKAGQSATITVDALDSQAPLTGTVTKVADTATTTNNVVSYTTTVTITDPPATLRTGMSASVSIAVQTKDNVLTVTTAAITTRSGSSYVNKLVDGKPVETQVTTGLQGDSTTEITSGLSEGDQLLVQTASVAATTGSNNGGGTLTGNTGFPGGGFGGGFPGGGGGGRTRTAN